MKIKDFEQWMTEFQIPWEPSMQRGVWWITGIVGNHRYLITAHLDGEILSLLFRFGENQIVDTNLDRLHFLLEKNDQPVPFDFTLDHEQRLHLSVRWPIDKLGRDFLNFLVLEMISHIDDIYPKVIALT